MGSWRRRKSLCNWVLFTTTDNIVFVPSLNESHHVVSLVNTLSLSGGYISDQTASNLEVKSRQVESWRNFTKNPYHLLTAIPIMRRFRFMKGMNTKIYHRYLFKFMRYNKCGWFTKKAPYWGSPEKGSGRIPSYLNWKELLISQGNPAMWVDRSTYSIILCYNRFVIRFIMICMLTYWESLSRDLPDILHIDRNLRRYSNSIYIQYSIFIICLINTLIQSLIVFSYQNKFYVGTWL